MLHSYSSIFNLGHKAVADLLTTPVLVEEKVDGSQFSFGVFLNSDGERNLKLRSRSSEIHLLAPEGMFKRAVEVVTSIESQLVPGWVYRGEYLAKPKHNTLTYERIPRNHIVIYDIDIGGECYLAPKEKAEEAFRLGLEVVPVLFDGKIDSVDSVRSFLDNVSFLGGPKIEGVVIKNYSLFGPDKKVMMGKFVSEHFKEVHSGEWKKANPSQSDIVQELINEYRSPARWSKAVQHLRESGGIEDSPKDIGKLMKEVSTDIYKECAEEIKEKLFKWAWGKIDRGAKGALQIAS